MTLHELEKFVRFFIQRSVQVIVQSRLGLETIQTNCNPTGKDWFSLNVPDLPEIAERTKKALDSLVTSDNCNQKLSLTRDWRICCEISLDAPDNKKMSLEYWVFSNEALYSSVENQKIASADIYDVYNRMGLLLKSIISLTRVTPARKLSTKGQGPDTYVFCYRVYVTEQSTDTLIGSADRKRYSPEIKLGSVGNQFSRLSVLFTYRTSMTSDPTAENNLMPVKFDHFTPETPKLHNTNASETLFDKRRPAFATVERSRVDALELIPENTLIDLLPAEPLKPIGEAVHSEKGKDGHNSLGEVTGVTGQAVSRESKITSSDDSYVFVEPIPPFASTDQKVLSSFFNGPAPSFTDSEKFTLQVSELEEKLRDLESTVPTWDSFVESICSSNADDES